MTVGEPARHLCGAGAAAKAGSPRADDSVMVDPRRLSVSISPLIRHVSGQQFATRPGDPVHSPRPCQRSAGHPRSPSAAASATRGSCAVRVTSVLVTRCVDAAAECDSQCRRTCELTAGYIASVNTYNGRRVTGERQRRLRHYKLGRDVSVGDTQNCHEPRGAAYSI